MKKVTQVLSVFVFVAAFAVSGFAQQTIAFVDSESIIPNMPEYKAAQKEIETYGKQLQNQLKSEEEKMQQFYTETMQKVQGGTMTPVDQKAAEEKLTGMQQKLQKDALAADQKLAKKETDLLKPLYEKFNAALTKVSQANSYTYILDKKLILLENGGVDATAKVKAELGL